jgi:protoporphyrinogen/coproporphyrinogen III oxidase
MARGSAGSVKVVVVGGGIAGLAAARRLVELLPGSRPLLLESEPSLGGKLRTEHVDGFVIEGSADSFLSRKARGVGLCEELGLGGELVGRRPEYARTFVRRGRELHPLPEGLKGMIPTNLDALRESALLSEEGRARLVGEVDIPPDAGRGDESIASFVSRRFGAEAYSHLVEPLMTGIFGGDGEQLSLHATFPQLRELELEHGSVLTGLAGQSAGDTGYPAFVSLAAGMERLVGQLADALVDRVDVTVGARAASLRRRSDDFVVGLERGAVLGADAVIIAVPAYEAAPLLAGIDHELGELHAEIPYASSVIITLAFRAEDVAHPLDGYGYVVPRIEGTDVLACTWSSRKWEGRAPEDAVLMRVYAGRFGGRDLTIESDDELVVRARDELRLLGIGAEPTLTRVHRWPRGMPQYVLGHPERVDRIEALAAEHPGLALAGAAYRGVGIPDCIRSGEGAAEAVARALVAPVR